MAEFEGLNQMLVDEVLIDEEEAEVLLTFWTSHREFRGQPGEVVALLEDSEGKAHDVWMLLGEGQQTVAISILESMGAADLALV